MKREKIKVIAINPDTGERMEFNSLYGLARKLAVSVPAVCQALDRGGSVKGWDLYYTAERYRELIAELEDRIRVIESL